MAAISRLFTAICRLLVQPDRVIFLACDLLRRPLSLAELPVISGMAGVWPLAFARPSDVKLVVAGRLNPAGVEAQPLSYAVEVVVTAMMRQSGQAEHLISKLHTLCQWSTGQVCSTVCTAETAGNVCGPTDHHCQNCRQTDVSFAATAADKWESDSGTGAMPGVVQAPPLSAHLPISAVIEASLLVQGLDMGK